MAAAAAVAAPLPRAPVSCPCATPASRIALLPARSNPRKAVAPASGALGWRRGELYPAISTVPGSARSTPAAVAVDPKIIYLGTPDGPTCHTGAETCYYSSVYDALQGSKSNQERQVATTLYSLEDTISRRKEEIVTEGSGKPSWTKKLLLDNQLLCSKIRHVVVTGGVGNTCFRAPAYKRVLSFFGPCEEAGELIQTLLENEDKSRTASEMADLLYHAMVLLSVKDVKMEEVLEVLRKRFSQSGVEEKASRSKS